MLIIGDRKSFSSQRLRCVAKAARSQDGGYCGVIFEYGSKPFLDQDENAKVWPPGVKSGDSGSFKD